MIVYVIRWVLIVIGATMWIGFMACTIFDLYYKRKEAFVCNMCERIAKALDSVTEKMKENK